MIEIIDKNITNLNYEVIIIIIADIHEPDELKQIADEVIDLGYDYLITGSEKTYVIERKTIGDFISSVYSKRIWYQADRILQLSSENNAYPILLLEGYHGNIENRKFGKMTLELFYGTLTALQENGIKIMFTSNIKHTKRFLKILDKRSGKKPNKIVFSVDKSTLDVDDERLKILCSLPGIGVKTAKMLLDKYGSLDRIFSLSLDEWSREVGRKRGERIFRILHD